MDTAEVYSVEEADLVQDRERIIDLWSRNLPSHTAEEHRARFDWHYAGNPLPGRRLFLAHHRPSDRIIGTSGLGIRQLFLNGTETIGGIAIDFAVDEGHRTLQPAIYLARAITKTIGSGVDFVYSLPNFNARPVFKRLGYTEVAPFRRFVKVLDSTVFLRRNPRLSSVAPVVGLPANAARKVSDAFRRGFANALEAKELAWSDPRINSLWESMGSSESIVGDRRSPYLDWRFAQCPLHDHELVGFIEPSRSEMVGYAVVYRNDEGHLKVPDLFLRPDASAARALMSLSHWADRHRASSVAFEVIRPSESIIQALQHTGFVERECHDKLFVFDKRPGSPAASIPWYFLRGDEFYNTF